MNDHSPVRIFASGSLYLITSDAPGDPRAKGRIYKPDLGALSSPLPLGSILAPPQCNGSWARVAAAEVPSRIWELLGHSVPRVV
jgi:hypothetical protein